MTFISLPSVHECSFLNWSYQSYRRRDSNTKVFHYIHQQPPLVLGKRSDTAPHQGREAPPHQLSTWWVVHGYGMSSQRLILPIRSTSREGGQICSVVESLTHQHLQLWENQRPDRLWKDLSLLSNTAASDSMYTHKRSFKREPWKGNEVLQLINFHLSYISVHARPALCPPTP